MVVLYHCGGLAALPKYWNRAWGQYFIWGHSGVNFFFVLSGVVILYAHWNDVGRPAALATYAVKRIRRIYPLYWIVLAVIIPVYFLIPSFGAASERNPLVIFESVVLVHFRHSESVLSVGWTLYHEVMFYALFAIVILNRRLGTILLSLWMAASTYCLVWPPANSILEIYISPLHLLFGFGICVLLFVRRTKASGMPFALIGAAGFIACCVGEGMAGNAAPYLNLLYGLFAALALGGCMLLEQQGSLAVPGILKSLGDASYSIYLVHFPVLSLLAKIMYRGCNRLRVPVVIPFLLLAIAGVAVGVAVHHFVEKPLLQLLGKRSPASGATNAAQG
jgi:peptidoglycan/LPS O-acetylase OafA/YrhL